MLRSWQPLPTDIVSKTEIDSESSIQACMCRFYRYEFCNISTHQHLVS